MDQSVAVTIERHIVDLEERVHKQDTLVKQLLAAELDAVQATLTLRALQQTLLLSREHLRFASRDEMWRPPPAELTAEHRALEADHAP